jgi:hypothetical protein
MYIKTAPKTAPATAPPSLGSSSEPMTVLLFPYVAVSVVVSAALFIADGINVVARKE